MSSNSIGSSDEPGLLLNESVLGEGEAEKLFGAPDAEPTLYWRPERAEYVPQSKDLNACWPTERGDFVAGEVDGLPVKLAL